MNTLEPHNFNELLSAYSDGELDAAQNLTVLNYLEKNPDAFSILQNCQRLHRASQRVVFADISANSVPNALQRQIKQIVGGETAERVTARGAAIDPSSRKVHWRPAGVAIAATWAAVGLLIGVFWNRIHATHLANPGLGSEIVVNQTPTKEQVDVRDANVPVSLIDAATHVHVDCSRVSEHQHSGAYPVALGPLAALVKGDLDSKAPEPDLTSIGYHYVGAGPCAKPLEGTVHLLYRKDGPEPRAAISVFAQSYHGQFGLQLGRLYRIGGEGDAFPMYAWRTKDVIYFLIADDMPTADAALRAIPNAPQQIGA